MIKKVTNRFIQEFIHLCHTPRKLRNLLCEYCCRDSGGLVACLKIEPNRRTNWGAVHSADCSPLRRQPAGPHRDLSFCLRSKPSYLSLYNFLRSMPNAVKQMYEATGIAKHSKIIVILFPTK